MNFIKTGSYLFKSAALIFFFITLLFSFVPTLYRGGNIYLFTFFIHFILLAVFFISTIYYNKIILTNENIFFYGFFLIWIMYNMISFWWSKNLPNTSKYSFIYFSYFIDFFVASQILNTKKLLKFFYVFLHAIIIIYIGIAIWELITWNHLPTSRLYGSKIFTPTGTFFNENDFAEVLLFLEPVLIFIPKIFEKTRLWKVICFIEIVVINVLFLIQGARIAMIFSMVILTSSFLIFLNKRNKLIIVSLIVGSFVLALTFSKPLQLFLKFEYETNVKTLLTEQESIYVGSIKIRKQMIKNSILMSVRSFGFGTGGGTYEDNMRIYSKAETAGIINCHNFIFELLATNGFIIFSLFLYFLFRLFRINYLAIKKDKNDYTAWLNIFFILLFIPATSLSSSSYKFFYFWPVLGVSVFHRNNISD
jgi:hypothetical protein